MLDKFLIISLLFFPSQAICEAISTKLSHGEKTHFNKYQSPQTNINNLGMNGLISLPSATALPDGELIFYQRNHDKLSRTGFTFQLLPRIGVSFRYSGHGKNGTEAFGRINHDRSFDIDFKCEGIAKVFNKPWVIDDWKFQASTQDIQSINFEEHVSTVRRADGSECNVLDVPDTIINTSCEHIENFTDWYAKIPNGKLVILQSNNYFEMLA